MQLPIKPVIFALMLLVLPTYANDLIFVCSLNSPPVCEQNKSPHLTPGRVNESGQGLLPDIIRIISDASEHINIRVHATHWNRGQKMVESGKADLFLTNNTPSRYKYAYFTKAPITQFYAAAFFLKQNPKIDALKNINNLKDVLQFSHVNYLGNGWFNQNLKAHVDTYITHDMNTSLNILKAQHVDVFVHNFLVTRFMSKANKKNSPFRYKLLKDSYIPYHLGVSKRTKNAQNIIKHLDSITQLPDVKNKIHDTLIRYGKKY